jgi:hypothetical protein
MFDGNDDAPVTLTINKTYANKYQTWREKEEKQKCKIEYFFYEFLDLFFVILVVARYGSDVEDDSDEESEDENAEVELKLYFYKIIIHSFE